MTILDKIFDKTIARLQQMPLWQCILLGFITITLFQLLLHGCLLLFGIEDFGKEYIIKKNSPNPKWVNLAILIVVAPSLETALFQALPFAILNKTKKLSSNKSIILISSSIFGVLHYYSFTYIVVAFIIGIILMILYLARAKKEDAFIAVFLTHALVNLLASLG